MCCLPPPNDGQPLALHALSLAYLGRTDEAVREGERAVELLQATSQGMGLRTYAQELLARIYVMAGERGKAVDLLQKLLASPSLLSRDRVRIDPHFAALRDDPGFQRLADVRKE